MSIVKFEFTYNTTTGEISVTNTDTGEMKSTKKKKVTIKPDDGTEPTLFLEDNKYRLNTAAINLMNVAPDDKLDIKYEKCGQSIIPVIMVDEHGNRLTKSYTVAYRGSKNQELSKYGTEFQVVPHKLKEGVFVLQNKNAKVEEEIKSEEFEVPLDIDDLLKDEDVTEIDSAIFKI